jgi:superoxide dismutase
MMLCSYRTPTLEMHYSKHYLTYTNNLNDAIVGTEYENQSIEDILSKLDPIDIELRIMPVVTTTTLYIGSLWLPMLVVYRYHSSSYQ